MRRYLTVNNRLVKYPDGKVVPFDVVVTRSNKVREAQFGNTKKKKVLALLAHETKFPGKTKWYIASA